MYFVSEPINDLRTLTKKFITKIVEDEFNTLATECGDVTPDAVSSAEWLSFYIPTRQLVVACAWEGALPLATINAAVTSEDIDIELAEAGIDSDEIDEDEREKLIHKIFEDNCRERRVAVFIYPGAGDDGGETGDMLWNDAWEARIREVVIKIIREED